MKYYCPRLHFRGGWLAAIVTMVIATPVVAQTANFGTFKLSSGLQPTQVTVSGYTGGSYSLSAMSNRDRHRRPCIGFADPKPDHIMVLEQDFPHLKLQLNSGGSDTTLLVQGPDDTTIRCGDDSGKNKDASIDDRNWKSGTYRVWIGTFSPRVEGNYTLTVQP